MPGAPGDGGPAAGGGPGGGAPPANGPGGGGGAPGTVPRSQTPDRSGLPSAVRGAGPLRSTCPFAVRGAPAVGYCGHCAHSPGARIANPTASFVYVPIPSDSVSKFPVHSLGSLRSVMHRQKQAGLCLHSAHAETDGLIAVCYARDGEIKLVESHEIWREAGVRRGDRDSTDA